MSSSGAEGMGAGVSNSQRLWLLGEAGANLGFKNQVFQP